MNPFLRCVFGCLLAGLLAGCAGMAPRDAHPPIVFVHGNGDSAAQWYPTAWRFESNGYDRSLLHAIDHANPLARTDDAVAQENRSESISPAEFRKRA